MGNHHRLLDVDLNAGTVSVKDLDPALYQQYIGGSTLAARLFVDTPFSKPLDPEGPLYVMVGPLVGTTFPDSSRFVLCARSPLTGIWGESASGGAFGADFKRAGFDGICITGEVEMSS